MEKIDYFGITPADLRLTTFPIARPNTYKYYEEAYKCFWTVEEVVFSTDADDYATKLSPDARHFVKHILAFFAASDGIVNLNLAKRFKKEVKMLEAGYFYDFQIMMENVHATMYSMLLDVIIVDTAEKNECLNAIQSMEIIAKMSEFMFNCIKSDDPLPVRLLRMACVEGIFFTGCFCAIYWLGDKGLMPALVHSNELIARDEALHTMFALHLYTMILPQYKLSVHAIHGIFADAVTLASEFITEALPRGMSEMSAELMIPYIQCQADNLLTLIDCPIMYNAKHNFSFMEKINMQNKTNFFERKVSEYSKVVETDKGDYEITTDF